MPTTPLAVSYIDPDGNNWNLSDVTMRAGYACAGIAGIDGLPTSMQLIPMLDGTSRTDLYIPQPGTITLGLMIDRPGDSGDENAYYALLDKLVYAFYNRRNRLPAPGYIQIQRPDGTTRQVQVFTTSGLDTPSVGIHNMLYTLTLQTPDPFWYDQQTQELIFSIGGSAPGILPMLPIVLGSSTIIGGASVLNSGGADAYPMWTLTGPGTPVIQNLTTGLQWSLNVPVTSGHVVQVITAPGEQSVVDLTTATNMWPNLVIPSLRSLWALVPGVNNINLSMTGSGPATSIQVNWMQRWLRS
jgi:hypothetical protein